MKNFPHQFNNIDKLFNALRVVKEIADNGLQLSDDNFGERLTRNGIYTYRNRDLNIEEFLESELQKPRANRGYLTVARDTRRFFELLAFITVFDDSVRLSPAAIQLLNTGDEETRKVLWKNSFQQLGLEGRDGEISHPYRILLKLVNQIPGIETKKLMLALEAENDTIEEFERIVGLERLTIEEIIVTTGTTPAMAANAVKILPGIAEQLGDITRENDRAYSVCDIVITEDDIATEQPSHVARVNFRETSSENIARDPNINLAISVTVDLSDAIRLRQRRLTEHQEIVRQLAALHNNMQYHIYEGKFDCLATKNDIAILYEVKTILPTLSDVEKQTVKGVGQLKFYKHSIVRNQMHIEDVREVLVFSNNPGRDIIDFCLVESINVVWKTNDVFNIAINNNESQVYIPDALL